MSTTTEQPATNLETTLVNRVYIKAPAHKVWDAITSPEWTDRYGYGGTFDRPLEAGKPYVALAGEGMQAVGVSGPAIDGEVLEHDPPRKLVLTWRMLMDDALEKLGFTRLTYEIEETGGVSKLTVTHEMPSDPALVTMLRGELEEQGGGGGWPWVLSDLKSLLETGTAFSREGVG